MEAKNFIRSLFDFSFRSFITGRVIPVLYVLMMISIIIEAVFFIALTFQFSSGLGILVLLIGAPIYLLISLIFLRVLLELIMVIFRIAENVHTLARGPGAQFTPGLEPAVATASVGAAVADSAPIAVSPDPPVPSLCTNCGGVLSPDARFCTSCGTARA